MDYNILKNARQLYKEIDEHYFEFQKKPAVVFDLDGVLSEYPSFWVQYANKQLGSNFCSLEELKKGTSRDRYCVLKERFRNCGIRKKMPVKKRAKELFTYLRMKGFTINILTARKKSDLIEQDTLQWLEQNGLMPDQLIWDCEKVKALQFHFRNVVFVVEDELRNALPIAEAGYKVYFLGSERVNHKNIISINSLEDLQCI